MVKSTKSQLLVLGALVILVGVVFAAYTQHVWEDYYITFRASKNLAEGNGLVFNVGERIHTFTSPLGVLLPAWAAWISGTQSDQIALWIYRLISLGALAGGCCLLVSAARQMKLSGIPAWLAGAWLALDAKTLDFAINGMEAGFWVAFLAYAIWAQLGGAKNWKHMGFAWAGLMWTRPDCFIHISLLAVSSLIFLAGRHGEGRSTMIASWLKAGLLTTVLYLPWFLWAWSYYGSPIPHTVTAKEGLRPFLTLTEQFAMVGKLPFGFLGYENSMVGTFLPAYYQLAGWNPNVIFAGKLLAGLAGLAWLLPKVSAPVRWLSFVYFGIHIYLTLVPYFAFPWYLPAAVPFAVLILAGLARDWGGGEGGGLKIWRCHLPTGVVALAVISSAALTWQVAQQMRAQQHLIEDGNRQPMGEYLAAHAQSGDTVFTEPLGYVGYFSGLRTYDFPGMSSPEMVVAREIVGNDWKDLIDHLQPHWLVLRPPEVERIERNTAWRVEHTYEKVAVFDQTEALANISVAGIGYLEHDAVFWLYQRLDRQAVKYDGWKGAADSPIVFHQRPWGGRIDINAHAELNFDIPTDAIKVNLQFGLFAPPPAADPAKRDGIRFGLEVRDLPRGTQLQSFFVEPTAEEKVIPMSFELPADRSAHATLRLVISPRVWRDHDACFLFLPDFVSAADEVAADAKKE